MAYRNLEKLAADTDVLRRFARQHIWNAPNRTTQTLGELYQVAQPPQPALINGRLQPQPVGYYSLDRDTLGLHGDFGNSGSRLGAALHENNERRAGQDLTRKLEDVGGPVAAVANGLKLPPDVIPTSTHLAASLPVRDLNIANTSWGDEAEDLSRFMTDLRQRRRTGRSEIEDLVRNVPIAQPLLANAGMLPGRREPFNVAEDAPPHMRYLARRMEGENPRAEGYRAFDQRGMPIDFLTSAEIVSRAANYVGPRGEDLISQRYHDGQMKLWREHPDELSEARFAGQQALDAQRDAERRDRQMLETLATNMNLRNMLTGAGTLAPPSPEFEDYANRYEARLRASYPAPPHRLNRNELRMIDNSFHRTYNPQFPQLLARRAPSLQTPATPLPAEQRSAFREALAAQPGLTRRQFLARQR